MSSPKKGVEIEVDSTGHMENCEFWTIKTHSPFYNCDNAWCDIFSIATHAWLQNILNSSLMSFNEGGMHPTCETAVLTISAGMVQKKAFPSSTGLLSVCS